jgi:hypothetical protein
MTNRTMECSRLTWTRFVRRLKGHLSPWRQDNEFPRPGGSCCASARLQASFSPLHESPPGYRFWMRRRDAPACRSSGPLPPRKDSVELLVAPELRTIPRGWPPHTQCSAASSGSSIV